jgi:hypothetical protein
VSATGPTDEARVAAAVAAAAHLMDLPGVEGVGRGETEEGQPAVVLLCAGVTDELRAQVPVEIQGVPVRVLDIGERPTAFGIGGPEQPHDGGELDCS